MIEDKLSINHNNFSIPFDYRKRNNNEQPEIIQHASSFLNGIYLAISQYLLTFVLPVAG